MLALSDQGELGIYDSRSAHGLSDLLDKDGRRIISIPPGRAIRGDGDAGGFCASFEKYIWVLRYLRTLAMSSEDLRAHFPRVADLEIAFFARSRSGAIPVTKYPPEPPQHLQGKAVRDEESMFWTLGPGKKAKPFWVVFGDTSTMVLTGEKGETSLALGSSQIADCLRHFSDGWFPLSNSKTAGDRDPGGLGEYFARNFRSSLFASHFAALWVHQGLLESDLTGREIRLKVSRLRFGNPAQATAR